MKILLLNVPLYDYDKNKPQNYNTMIPIGLGYLATILRHNKFETRLLDAEYWRMSPNKIVAKIKRFKPVILGVNLPSPSLGISKKIIRQIPKGIHICVGGIQATLEPERCVEYLKPDSLIVGEAEEAILHLAKNYYRLKGHKFPSLRGLYFKKDFSDLNDFKRTKAINNLDNLPFLDRSFFSNEPYLTTIGKEMSLSTSRGCPFNCQFCSVPVMFGNKVRVRSSSSIIKEINILKNKYDLDSIRFMDDNFIHYPKKVSILLKKLEKTGIRWRALVRLDALSQKLIKSFARSGCYQLSFGIENLNPKIQTLLNKKNSIKRIAKITKWCRLYHLKTKGFFTLAYPGEKKSKILRNLEYSYRLGLDEANYSILRAFPGTRLGDQVFGKKRFRRFHQYKTLNSSRGLNIIEKKRLNYILKRGINPNSYLKYHFSNQKPLNGMTLHEADLVVRKAYINFHYLRLKNEGRKRD